MNLALSSSQPPAPATSPASALRVDVTVLRDRAVVVRDVAFDIASDDVLGIVGRNGAGKTSLIHGLFGMLPTVGRVEFLGEDVSGLATYRRAARGMALVPQGRRLFPRLTVAENLRAAEVASRGTGPEFDVFELFPALRGLMKRRAGVLSGGQQQQAAIARALLRRPYLLFLDEPSEGLSPSLVDEVIHALERLRESGLTIVIAEQHLRVIEELCTRFLVLRAGEVAAYDTTASAAVRSEVLSLGETRPTDT